ncbi:DUF1727 domain-containing protein [bacterium]|nr:DUF1727 domain-containing protein [bacterium]
MGKIRFYISLIISRLIYIAIKILNKSSGTSFIGMVVLKICPKFLTYCRKYVKNKVVAITGTNGKSTTSGLVAHMLEGANQSVVHNLKGANMLTGVANAFALSILPFKRFDYGVIESDEAYLTKLYDYLKSDYLIVTNLFRDQLDRYGELATTAGFIQNAIDKNPDATLILNADDPLVANFAKGRDKIVFYGFNNVEYDYAYENSNSPTEVFNCICGKPLEYSKRFFAQEGHYYCSCGFKRPICDYCADAKIYKNKIELTIEHNGIKYSFNAGLVGLYNAYNVLGAIAFAFENGLNQEEIQKSLDSYKSIFGRTEKRTINGHNTIIQLIKNPTGASEVLKTVDLNSNILIAINDNYADGRDISWLWDSDFEQLKNAQKLVITSGIRANDMALRLKYAGINQDKIKIEPDIKKAIEIAAGEGNSDVTILPSYTALLKINKMKLKK